MAIRTICTLKEVPAITAAPKVTVSSPEEFERVLNQMLTKYEKWEELSPPKPQLNCREEHFVSTLEVGMGLLLVQTVAFLIFMYLDHRKSMKEIG